MTMQDDLGARTHAAEVQQCIARCRDTHQLSIAALEQCSRLGGAHATPAYLHLLHDTAQVTLATADALAQPAPDAARTCARCAEVTHQAAQATEGRAPDPRMQTFIRHCRACAAACRHLAQMTDEPGSA